MPWEQLPGLTGIIEAPTLRPDGSLLTKPGYDEATGLLFVPGETAFPEIPDKPTREQAEAALKLLKQPFAAFPFADEAARAVAVSSVMTVLIRRVLRAAPMHAFTAPKMASGKTLLATIPSYVATGRAPYLISQAADPESERKRLLAALIEGPPLIVIDNIEKPLKSDALSTVLTEPTFTDRLLGVSKTLTVPTNCMLAATGNNLVLHGDLSARGLLCELDPACELSLPRLSGRLVKVGTTSTGRG
jgi:putative DNA primase/helicase